MTKCNSEEYAASDRPNQSSPGQGLPEYVSNNEAIANEDLVLWYTMGNTHIVRPEDWPVMPVITQGLKLVPRGGSGENKRAFLINYEIEMLPISIAIG